MKFKQKYSWGDIIQNGQKKKYGKRCYNTCICKVCNDVGKYYTDYGTYKNTFKNKLWDIFTGNTGY